MLPATRRQFLKTLSAASLGGAAPFAANLSAFNAFAADTSGYKALVCVFLFGGMDGHDLVIPFDQTSYDDWADLRAPLIPSYGGSRDRAQLLQLSGASLGGREFALTEEMRPIHELFTAGDAAVIGNVGPLIEPTTRTTYRDDTARRPPRLFSHNDQQSVWMASEPEGASVGWGGRFADLMLASSANPSATFTAISASGNAVFLTGNQARQFQVDRNGAATIDAVGRSSFLGSSALPGIIEDHLRDTGASQSNLFGQDLVNITGFSLDTNETLDDALEAAPDTTTVFPENGRLSDQLEIVARIISQRQTLGVNRQVFFVSTGGFDTHSNQANSLPGLLQRVSGAVRAFHDTMTELGLQNDVTTFTASDFGRTLQVNGDGTDHGWGNHHLVVGGAVNGGQILGDIPVAAFDHEQDSGRGRLIPGLSVEQLAASLGGWFGLTPSELTEALPGLGAFDANALSGLFDAGST